MIPFFNITAENAPYAKEFAQELQQFLNEGQFILGDAVASFEKKFATFCGTNFCIGTSNGLDALRLIFEGYKSLGLLKDGDSVLVPAHTYIASILAVVQAGLKPVFVEPKKDSFGMDVDQAIRLTTPDVKACLVVHLYGELIDVDAFRNYANQNAILLIEDAAQAHGAVAKNGLKAGAIGNAAAFSFYPTKNIGALGDAGAVTTNNDALAHKIRMLQNYGSSSKNAHEILGFNMRLDALQARFLSCKIGDYPYKIKCRTAIALRYSNEVKNTKITLPKFLDNGTHVFHLFVVRVENRDDFMAYLTSNGVGCIVHYPTPPHKQKALFDYHNLPLPITEQYHDEVVSVPLYPSLSENQIQYIIDVLNAY